MTKHVVWMGAAMALVACSGAVSAEDEEGPTPVVDRTLLTDFSTDLVKSDANATVSLRFFDIRELPNGHSGDVVVQLERRGGRWAQKGHAAAADYNQRSENQVTLDDLAYADGKLRGTIGVTITPDRPRPGGGNLGPHPFPDPKQGPDVYTVTVEAQLGDGPAPFIADTEKHEPPWRKDTPMFGGRLIEGTYIAKRGDVTTQGKVVGALSPAGNDDAFNTFGNIHLSPADGGGVAVLARMSPVPVMSYASCGAVRAFAQPRDWSDQHALLLTLDNHERRNDVTVQLGVKPKGQGMRWVDSAGFLIGREHTFLVPLHRFSPTLGEVEAVGLGVHNADGVGDVRFTLRKLELATLAYHGPRDLPRQPVTITVKPDTRRVHNGVADIPKGLFGMHGVNWPSEADDAALGYIRSINPGYIRPLDHTGFGGKRMTAQEIEAGRAQRLKRDEPDDKVYLVMKAADAVDNVVWCHTQDLFARPSWMHDGVEAWEKRVADFYHNQAARAWVPGDAFNVLRRFEVWNEPFFWGRHTNMNHRLPKGARDWTDDTQHGYIPGKLGADVYSRLFMAAAQAGGAVNEHARFGGPSSPSFNGDGYRIFTNYVARFIDRCIDEVGFLTEHHYGGNPASYAASYEVATAYNDITHGRRIPVYNTEANNLGASDAGKAAYNVEDILTGAIVNPDIYRGRALHALWSGKLRDAGELHAYRILSTLRGAMVVCESNQPGVIAVATRPEAGGLVVVAYNANWSPRTVSLETPGQPAKVTEAVMLLADAPANEQNLRDPEGQPIPAPPQGKTRLVTLDPKGSATLELPARSVVRWTCEAAGEPSKAQVTRQSFVDAVFADVEPGKPVEAKVVWRGELKPGDADAAALRVVTADVHDNEAYADINGHTITLPYTDAGGGDAEVQTIAIDPAWLAESTKLTFRVLDPATQNGYRVLCASVLLTGAQDGGSP